MITSQIAGKWVLKLVLKLGQTNSTNPMHKRTIRSCLVSTCTCCIVMEIDKTRWWETPSSYGSYGQTPLTFMSVCDSVPSSLLSVHEHRVHGNYKIETIAHAKLGPSLSRWEVTSRDPEMSSSVRRVVQYGVWTQWLCWLEPKYRQRLGKILPTDLTLERKATVDDPKGTAWIFPISISPLSSKLIDRHVDHCWPVDETRGKKGKKHTLRDDFSIFCTKKVHVCLACVLVARSRSQNAQETCDAWKKPQTIVDHAHVVLWRVAIRPGYTCTRYPGTRYSDFKGSWPSRLTGSTRPAPGLRTCNHMRHATAMKVLVVLFVVNKERCLPWPKFCVYCEL